MTASNRRRRTENISRSGSHRTITRWEKEKGGFFEAVLPGNETVIHPVRILGS